MKKRAFGRLITIFFAVIVVISLAGLAISKTPQETMTIKGKIVSISADTGKIEVVDESGKTITLNAGSGIDLKECNAGDQANIEYSSDGVIKSITLSSIQR